MNIAEMKRKLQNLNNKGRGSDVLLKLEEGETIIRIVPLKGNPDDPFVDLKFYYGLGTQKTILSPLSYGERDPINEFCDSLVGEGKLSKEDFKAAMKFRPQIRTFVPVVVRGKESEGVKFWSFGKTIKEKLLNVILDEDYGDITSTSEGNDIRLTYTPQEKSDTNYAKTDVQMRPKKSVLTTDKALEKKLLDEQPALMETYKKWSYDELSTYLQTYINGLSGGDTAPSADAPKDTTGEAGWAVEESPTAASSKEAVTPKATEDLDADFSNIFKD
jgi:hypothetical protein